MISRVDPDSRHDGHDTKPSSIDHGLDIIAAADALNPVGDSNYANSSEPLSGSGIVHSFIRAAPSSEVLPKPLASFSPVVYPAAFAQHRGPSGNLRAPFQDRSATRPTKNERGITEWNRGTEEETVPSGTPFKQSRPTFIRAQAKTPAVQLTHNPRFEVSSHPVAPHSTQTTLPPPSLQSLSPSTYESTQDGDGKIRDGIFNPFNEELDGDDGDDEIVWDPRPRFLPFVKFEKFLVLTEWGLVVPQLLRLHHPPVKFSLSTFIPRA